MAEDIARLGLEIDSKDVKKATSELGKLEKQSGETERSARRLGDGFSAMGGAIAALGVGLVVHEIISINAEFSKLHGALVTVTGSTEAANDVVDRMKILMTEVPGSLNDLTNSFIKLKALGLDPSERAIISYSNTAAAMGKDLNQMIEAVADAATGEFERLKEFGIKSASEGDRVKFTFQGVTKEVGKNSQEIQDYLLSIGEVQFAGAAAKQMETFGGAIDNLGSQISALAIDSTGMPAATRAINELSQVIADPKTKEGVDNLVGAVATLITWAAKGATAFVEFGEGIGNFMGRLATGVYLVDEHVAATKSLTQQVEDQKSVFESASIVQQAAIKNYNDISSSLAALSATHPEATAAIATLTEEQSKAQLQVQMTTEALEKERESLGRLVEEKASQPKAEEDTASTAAAAVDTKLQEKLEKQLEILKEYYASDEEQALNSLLKKQSMITELEDAHIGTEDERRQLRLEATQEYEDSLLSIAQDRLDKEANLKSKRDKDEEDRVRKNTAFAIRMAESGNKDATALLKGYLLDQAKMLGKAAIVGAYKWGAAIGGPLGGAAAAGAASLAVGAIISAIQNGGGGSGGGGGGGAANSGSTLGEGGGIGPAPRGIEDAPQPQERVIRFPDLDPDSFMTVKGMFKMMNEATDRGYRFEAG